MSKAVSEIMITDLITVTLEDNLKEVANVFDNIKIRHVPVVSGDTLLGMVSKSDVAMMKQFCQVLDSGDRTLFEELEAVSVKALMKRPITIGPEGTISEAADIFLKNHFHALPVVDGTRLVGIVTSTDLLKYYRTKEQ
ncbi:MAG: CBS domain-containing protein [Reichenbachiella sp.]|uniref:CBS domain-containing protein n=2 Tax=Reichenbachiella sp. TaxID=2184521 RepID=UPI0029661D49|nr:CBS domain-containing protein [Reichenbachiella sp.]MDW3209728.1 CBS domain-containing protein [Reichenbachiella sp.]